MKQRNDWIVHQISREQQLSLSDKLFSVHFLLTLNEEAWRKMGPSVGAPPGYAGTSWDARDSLDPLKLFRTPETLSNFWDPARQNLVGP